MHAFATCCQDGGFEDLYNVPGRSDFADRDKGKVAGFDMEFPLMTSLNCAGHILDNVRKVCGSAERFHANIFWKLQGSNSVAEAVDNLKEWEKYPIVSPGSSPAHFPAPAPTRRSCDDLAESAASLKAPPPRARLPTLQGKAYLKGIAPEKWIRYAQVAAGSTTCGERTSNLAEHEMAAQIPMRNGLRSQDALGYASVGSAMMLDKVSSHIKLHEEWQKAGLTLVRRRRNVHGGTPPFPTSVSAPDLRRYFQPLSLPLTHAAVSNLYLCP